MSLLQYFHEVWVWSQCREQQYLRDVLSLALEPVLSWMPGVAFYKDAPINEKCKDGFKAGSFQYVLALWHCAIWRGARWMVAPCPCSVLCLLLGVLTVVYIAVTLWVRVPEFLLFWGSAAVCKSTTVSLLSKTPFINAVVRPLAGTEFLGYHILHLHLVRMAAVGLT